MSGRDWLYVGTYICLLAGAGLRYISDAAALFAFSAGALLFFARDLVERRKS